MHAINRGSGIFWTATDDSPSYSPDMPDLDNWFVENDRPFTHAARELAHWARDKDVLMISSLENPTARDLPDGSAEPVYCDDYDADADYWIPLCGELDDYLAHSGTGMDKVLFVGALDEWGQGRSGIRSDGVFAPHAIYVRSPDRSTSQATPVLAAYAANLWSANPRWGAARVRRELMDLARDETLDHYSGSIGADGIVIVEERTVKVIRPEFAPTGTN